MTINYTTLLGLAKPVTGTETGQWGDVVNDQITSLVEDAIANAATINVAAGNVTLTNNNGSSDQSRMAILLVTGSPGVSRNIIAPSRSKWYIVKNGSDAAVVVKGSATTGTTIAAGNTQMVFWDGLDFVPTVTIVNLASGVTGTLSVGNGGTGATTLTGVLKGNGTSAVTASNVDLATEVTGTLPVANGGTGATTSTGSGSVVLATNPTIDRATFTGNAQTTPVVVTFSATAMTVDCTESNVFTTTLTASVTVAPTLSDPQDGQTINWFLTQDGTGGRTITWPTSFKWPSGANKILSTGANAVDLLTATYRSTTGFWYATLLKAFL